MQEEGRGRRKFANREAAVADETPAETQDAKFGARLTKWLPSDPARQTFEPRT
jgi:hypothetical protein